MLVCPCCHSSIKPAYVGQAYPWNITIPILFTFTVRSVASSKSRNISQESPRPTFLYAQTLLSYIYNRSIQPLRKHLDKDRLRQLIQLRQSLPTLGAKSVGLIQNGGDAALFG